ncbi:MAG: hypothetical protein LBF50_04050 [Azoarcus sp.]|nr:hypothetical protein [Azoarcus sp.]
MTVVFDPGALARRINEAGDLERVGVAVFEYGFLARGVDQVGQAVLSS